tara:strand:+ start:7350 stop:7892 length:543 start_codon:yes stop_codon:yes gene_type:complete
MAPLPIAFLTEEDKEDIVYRLSLKAYKKAKNNKKYDDILMMWSGLFFGGFFCLHCNRSLNTLSTGKKSEKPAAFVLCGMCYGNVYDMTKRLADEVFNSEIEVPFDDLYAISDYYKCTKKEDDGRKLWTGGPTCTQLVDETNMVARNVKAGRINPKDIMDKLKLNKKAEDKHGSLRRVRYI